MNLGKALENLKYDNRMADWNLKEGILTEKEITAHNETLPDLSEKSRPLDLEGESRRSSTPAASLNGSSNPLQ